LLIAQELYFVFHQLQTTGVITTIQRSSGFVWGTLFSLLLLQAAEAISVFVAGMFTGASQKRGAVLGAVVGVWSGLIFILVQQWYGQRSLSVAVFFEPILQAAFGGLGGLVGSWMWKPPTAKPAVARKTPAALIFPFRQAPMAFGGPIAWGRVLSGVTLAVSGGVWADAIREFVLQAGKGVLSVDSTLEAQLMTWEISSLAVVAGGAWAGATTLNGLSHGLWVGLSAGLIVTGLRWVNAGMSFELIAMSFVTSMCLALVGSWFGSQLVPPVQKKSRRRTLLASG
jgi:hypothetical protein